MVCSFWHFCLTFWKKVNTAYGRIQTEWIWIATGTRSGTWAPRILQIKRMVSVPSASCLASNHIESLSERKQSSVKVRAIKRFSWEDLRSDVFSFLIFWFFCCLCKSNLSHQSHTFVRFTFSATCVFKTRWVFCYQSGWVVQCSKCSKCPRPETQMVRDLISNFQPTTFLSVPCIVQRCRWSCSSKMCFYIFISNHFIQKWQCWARSTAVKKKSILKPPSRSPTMVPIIVSLELGFWWVKVHSGTLGLYMPWAYDSQHLATRNRAAMLSILQDCHDNTFGQV